MKNSKRDAEASGTTPIKRPENADDDREEGIDYFDIPPLRKVNLLGVGHDYIRRQVEAKKRQVKRSGVPQAAPASSPRT